MTQNTFSVHFILKKDKMDKDGFAPIYAKITLNNQRIELSLNKKVLPKHWLSKEEIAKPNTEESKLTNTLIDGMKTKLYLIYSSLLSTNETLNAQNFKAAFYGEDNKMLPTLLEIVKQHNDHFEKMIGIKYS